MPTLIEPLTPRLHLRHWQDADRAPYAALNADAQVMRWFPALLSAEQSNAAVNRHQTQFAQHGWGLWAVERRDTGEFIGFVGLAVPRAELPCSPCVEVGWRLVRAHWHQGFATEAARAALQVGFEPLGLDEIVSFTALGNAPSRAVMQRIGMTHRPDQDFEHPGVPEGHPLRRHCLYRLSASDWRRQQAALISA
jgi:RimJ/RimL family protein N-acetyltransferase